MLLKAYIKASAMADDAKAFLKRLRGDESGASMVEYALLAALISIAAIVMITNVGTEVNDTFTKINTKLSAATP